MNFLEKIPYFGKEKSSAEAEYKHNEIEAIRKPFLILVEKLKEDINLGTYDAIIGDDASGRIPTLALWNVMKERMRQAHPGLSPEEDRDMLKTYFVAGGRNVANEENQADFFEKIQPEVRKKALFVTEYIATGESIKRVGELLESKNISFDIATLGFAIDEHQQRTEPVKSFFLRHKIFSGEYVSMTSAPKIYGEHGLAGVQKYPNQKSPHAYKFFDRNNPVLEKSRQDIKKLSTEASGKVWGK